MFQRELDTWEKEVQSPRLESFNEENLIND